MGPEGVQISEMFGLGECLIFYVERTEIYMNIIKSRVRISDARISEVLLYNCIYSVLSRYFHRTA